MALVFILLAILYGLLNIKIYKDGEAFAKEYNATRFEIDYHYPDPGNQGSPSFFRFYTLNKNGLERDLIYYNLLFEPYEKMNNNHDSLYEGLRMLFSLTLVVSVVGIIYSIFNKFQPYGYIISTVITFLIALSIGMLKVFSIVYIFGLLLSAFLLLTTKKLKNN